MATYWYVEADGQLYLVDRDGRKSLPLAEEVPFEVEDREGLNFPDADVRFCVPKDHRYRGDWIPKDSVPARTDVDPLVHRAVNATLVREVTGAVIVDSGDILLVNASRGFSKGFWNIPGGFILYGETPEAGVAREVAEEVGVDIRIERLLGVFTRRFSSPYFMRAHVFLCRAASRDLQVDAEEISEARWFTLEEAQGVTRNPFARKVLADVAAQER